MNNIAIFDFGTASLKFCILKEIEDNKINILYEDIDIIKLGENLNKNNYLSEVAISRCFNSLDKFYNILKEYNVKKCYAIGTKALRQAKNSLEFLEKVNLKYNLTIDIISEDEEAEYSFKAANYFLNLKRKKVLVFDIGGGSTEFIYGINDEIIFKKSLPLGALHLKEMFIIKDPPIDSEINSLYNYVLESLKNNIYSFDIDYIIGIGGTVTTIASVKLNNKIYIKEEIHNQKINYFDISKQLDIYKSISLDDRKKINGLCPERAEFIIAGVIEIKAILDFFLKEEIIVSTYGARHGYIIKNLNK